MLDLVAAPATDPNQKATNVTDPAPQPSIGCVVPASDAQDSISQVVESLLAQTRVPRVIHVVVAATSDATFQFASRYAGPHTSVTPLGEQLTEVFVHRIGDDSARGVGALNYGYTMVEGYDYLLRVDGDTVADAEAVDHLRSEVAADGRVGLISAIPASIGGSLSLVATRALRAVMDQNHRDSPWPLDGDANTLRAQIERAGYIATIDPFARASRVGRTSSQMVGGRAGEGWGRTGLGSRG